LLHSEESSLDALDWKGTKEEFLEMVERVNLEIAEMV